MLGDLRRKEKTDLKECVMLSQSGTNWLMQITYQIATRGEGDFEHIHEVVPWIEGT